MKRHPLLLLLLLLVAAAAVGDRFFPYGIYRPAPQWAEEAVSAQGVVTQLPTVTAHTERCVVRLIGDASLVQLTLHQPHAKDSLRDATLHPGDLIAFHARIEEPHNGFRNNKNAGRVGAQTVQRKQPKTMDYTAYLRRQGVTGMAFCPEGQYRNLGTYSRLNLRERMLRYRQELVDVFARHLEGKPLAIVAAMTLGDKTRVDRSTRDLYSQTGASHILALSGLHLSILYGLLVLFFVRPLQRLVGGKRMWTVAAGVFPLLSLWCFVLLAACPVSLVRAATMLTLMTILNLLRRTPDSYDTLLLTLIILLVVSPALVFDVGLQLSAVSVAAILFVSKRLPTFGDLPTTRTLWQSCIRVVVTLIVVSLTAQIATMPLVVYYFGRCSLVGIFSSLFVIPAAYVILLGAVAFLLVPPLRVWLAMLLTWVIDGLHSVMTQMSGWPVASVECHLSWWGVTACYVLLVWLAVRTAQGRLGKNRTARLKTFLTAVSLALLVVLVESIHDVYELKAERTAILQHLNEKN